MPATFQEALPYIGIAIAILVILLSIRVLMRANRKVTVLDRESSDVLDEGAAPAARNQALIDAPRSMEQQFGDTTAVANTQAVAAAGAEADAEAGASPAASGLAAVQAAPDPEPTPSPAPAPAPAPASAPAPAPASTGDDLTRIKGLGPKLVTLLAEQGVTRFDQIAAWSDADVARIDAGLGRFQGRIERDRWVEQARLLAAGDEAGFTNSFGRNG